MELNEQGFKIYDKDFYDFVSDALLGNSKRLEKRMREIMQENVKAAVIVAREYDPELCMIYCHGFDETETMLESCLQILRTEKKKGE